MKHMANLSDIVSKLANRAFGAIGSGIEGIMQGASRTAKNWWEDFSNSQVSFGQKPGPSTGGGINSILPGNIRVGPTPTLIDPSPSQPDMGGDQQYYEQMMAKSGMNPRGTPFPTPTGGQIPGFITPNSRLTPDLAELITSAAQQHGVNPALLAANLQQESSLNPTSVNADPERGFRARGMAQIVDKFHPEVTDQQAFDPNFAVPWAAKYLSDKMRQNTLEQAIASYFVGNRVGPGAGRDERGLGPQGREYLNNIIRNLDPQVIRELGLQTQY